MAQFACLAGVLFLVNAAMHDNENSIHVTEDVITALVEAKQDVLGRAVTPDERDQLIDAYVNEEVLLRAALAEGLDQGDGRVRQRLISKMLFLLEEVAPDPAEADLQAFYESNPELYSTLPSMTFHHVFYESVPQDPASILTQLNQGAAPDTLGQRFWMGSKLDRITQAELIAVLGPEFAKQVEALEVGGWYGPLHSGRGVHFVEVLTRHASELLAPEVVSARLREDWARWWQGNARARSLEDLRHDYEIVIETRERSS